VLPSNNPGRGGAFARNWIKDYAQKRGHFRFVERYENVAIAAFNTRWLAKSPKPFLLNARCYSCFLLRSDLPNRFRTLDEDTDMTLQVIADGWCSILFNAFVVDMASPLQMQGGQTPNYLGDGKLKQARELERMWPGVVSVKRKYGRPHKRIAYSWTHFDNKLIRKKGVRVKQGADEQGLSLRAVAPIKSQRIKRIYDDAK
jgi:hypothetical protein